MGKLDVHVMRHISKDEYRVLTAVELGMRNHHAAQRPSGATPFERTTAQAVDSLLKNLKTRAAHRHERREAAVRARRERHGARADAEREDLGRDQPRARPRAERKKRHVNGERRDGQRDVLGRRRDGQEDQARREAHVRRDHQWSPAQFRMVVEAARDDNHGDLGGTQPVRLEK